MTVSFFYGPQRLWPYRLYWFPLLWFIRLNTCALRTNGWKINCPCVCPCPHWRYRFDANKASDTCRVDIVSAEHTNLVGMWIVFPVPWRRSRSYRLDSRGGFPCKFILAGCFAYRVGNGVGYGETLGWHGPSCFCVQACRVAWKFELMCSQVGVGHSSSACNIKVISQLNSFEQLTPFLETRWNKLNVGKNKFQKLSPFFILCGYSVTTHKPISAIADLGLGQVLYSFALSEATG